MLPRGVRRLFRIDGRWGGAHDDIDEELRHHFEAAIAAEMRDGIDEDEAQRRVYERFGDERAYRAALRNIRRGRVRMGQGTDLIDAMTGALRRAVRGLRRSPGFALSVAFVLSLGIGANAVMFGVVDRLLLSPPQHVEAADDVRLIHVRRTVFNGEVFTGRSLTWPDYTDLESVESFASVAAYTNAQPLTIGGGDAATKAETSGVSASLFPLLGVGPRMGRFFLESDDRPEAPGVAVLAHEYWERAFGADPDILGRMLELGAGSYEVVGVAPPGLTGAELFPVDIWVPIQRLQTFENGDGWVDQRGWYWLQAVARLADGASDEAAQTEATAAHRAGRAELIAADRYDDEAEILAAPVIAAHGPNPSSEALVARWLGGVSLIVLLIACFNVANLLLARAVHTRREVAVRLALGVGRGRLVGELVLEAIVLAGLGAMAAVFVAQLLGSTIHRALLPGVSFADRGLDLRLVGFAFAATLVAGLVTAIAPALQATRTDLVQALRSGGVRTGGRGSRTRVALLVGQAALSVVLLVGAGLFVRSLRQAEQLDLGFDADRVAVVMLEWEEAPSATIRAEIYGDVLDRIRRLPEVRSAGLTYTIPFYSSISLGQPRVPGLDSVPRHHSGGPYVNKVGDGYLQAMGLSVLTGRGIEAIDDGDGRPPVAVVSQSMADAYWPAGDAVGSCMIFDEDEPVCTQVVGVLENHRRQELVEDDAHFLYYVNQSHPDFQGPPQAMMVGTRGDPASLLETIRTEARSVSPSIRFVSAMAMDDLIEPERRSWALGASMFTVFGALALLVAAWGLYSVLAFDVALRRHELGVRTALGAGAPRLVRMVLRRAILLVGFGTGLGVLAAMAAAPAVRPLLFDVSGRDPLTYGIVVVLLLLAGAVAGTVPAVRATRVDPREALTSE